MWRATDDVVCVACFGLVSEAVEFAFSCEDETHHEQALAHQNVVLYQQNAPKRGLNAVKFCYCHMPLLKFDQLLDTEVWRAASGPLGLLIFGVSK